MPAILIDRETTAWIHQKPEWMCCRIHVERDMARMFYGNNKHMTCRICGGEHPYSMRIKDMPSLWPYNHIRVAVIDGCKKWLQQMAIQDCHYELIENEEDMRVRGPVPYLEKGIESQVRANMRRVNLRTLEERYPDGQADMIVSAHFKAKYAYDLPPFERVQFKAQEEEPV
jgi:hypothetical protein